jgi:hypothetical protein
MSSLLGKLFSGLPSNGSSTRSTNPLDSNLEDHFTHNLLFPDAEALCHHDQVFALSSGTVLAPATVNAFDVNAELDLEMRDVRVIIMQEATTTTGSAYLLYDSHPAPPSSPPLERQPSVYSTPGEGRRSISSPRRTSVGHISRPVIIQQEPAPRPFGAFDRRPTPHGRTFSHNETEGQRSAREYREEVTSFSNCIFGASDTLAYKGAGTKLHILPVESRSTSTSGSYVGEGSLGRSSMRSSKLAQSFTSDSVGSGLPPAGFAHTATVPRGSDKKKVLITRIFPVPLPNDDADDTDESQKRTPTAHSHAAEASAYPFPKVSEHGLPQKKKPHQNKTPMYAVGLVMHLPAAAHAPSTPASRSSFRSPSSYTEQDSFPSSFNSARHAGWTVLGHGFGVQSLDPPLSNDVDDRIDVITQHWDIIMRTLSRLQVVATASLLPMLKIANISSPSPQKHIRTSSASVSIAGKRVEDVKPFKIQKPNIKYVQLTANCLMQVEKIHKEVDASRQRILSGIKTCQVITGQGRWGIWREEARLVGKWAGGKDEGFFFFNLLTGFLGNHTEWLQALGPSWYRRRHYQQQRANRDEDMSLPARTIILSDNKLMARRLIFLLSGFLPANQHQRLSRFHRPSTSTSFVYPSQSPPKYVVPILREESLRRRINKRASGVRGAHTRTMSFPTQAPHGTGLEIHHHDRRTSDAASVKTANLPIPGSDIGTRKSSAATTSTITPVTTMPHFSTRRSVRGTGPAPSPGSSGSLATEDLIRSLKRDDSTGQYSNGSTDSHGQGSRWGSMISGFWGSSKRRGSTTATSPPTVEGPGINDTRYKGRNRNKVREMVDEASCICYAKSTKIDQEVRESDSGSAETARPESDAAGDEVTEQTVHFHERTPDPSGAYESPVKTSIKDGIIDIDVPLPEYLSFETAVSSPSSSGYSFSTPGFGNGMEGFEHYSRAGRDSDTTMNVGGWLPRYNPDFVLQATPLQPDLLQEIKDSMRNEPTPVIFSTQHPDSTHEGCWVDISSAIVADTTNFSIKHIRYRRLIKPTSVEQIAPSNTQNLESKYGDVYSTALLTPSLDVHDGEIEECFIEKSIISMDETLIEAVERIMAHSGAGSKGSSVSSSRSTSRKGGVEDRDRSDSELREVTVPEPKLEVPRNECKKTVLGALEEIVRSVIESREREENEHMTSADRELVREKESFLREGVRTWLEAVEGCE